MDSSSNKLILAFVTLIIGAVLIGTISTNATTVTYLTGARDANTVAKNASGYDLVNTTIYSLTNKPTTTLWKSMNSDCYISSFVLRNSSGTEYTVTTDYVLNSANGTFTLKGTSAIMNGTLLDNLTYASYKYCGDTYMTEAWSRSVLNLVAGFFAIAMLLISVALFFSVAKENGIV